jgi:hypothetical protein
MSPDSDRKNVNAGHPRKQPSQKTGRTSFSDRCKEPSVMTLKDSQDVAPFVPASNEGSVSELRVKLERQSRVVKYCAILLFVILVFGFGIIEWQVKRRIGSSSARIEADMISAHQLEIYDKNGQGKALLTGTMFFLGGPNGKTELMVAPQKDGVSLSLLDLNGKERLTLSVGEGEQKIDLTAAGPYSWLSMGGPDKYQQDRDRIEITAGGDQPNISISDKSGFEAILGRAALVKRQTGEDERTSAASLTLFDNDGHVLWMTPKH